ncbi:MAG TPA: single-stranded DNA-binding protein [Solirubrobacteraceae bacterium]|nr:single-stranded DNA-binding protein [Solirubrobacteraceae bacterium]
MNTTQQIGNLTADPQPVTQTEHGPVTTFRLAVPRAKGSRKKADFFTVEVWGKQAESAAQWLKEGREVAVAGRLEQREWRDDNDVWHERVIIVARTVDYLRGAGKEEPVASEPVAPDATGDTVPAGEPVAV